MRQGHRSIFVGGRIMEDAVCECGYVIEAQEAILKVTDRKKEG